MLDTSRLNEVNTPQHAGTPRSHVIGIHQCGSLSSWPSFLSSSDENSFSSAERKAAVSEKDPKDVPTCLTDPSAFVICRAVAWSTFSTWQAAPAFVSWCFFVVAAPLAVCGLHFASMAYWRDAWTLVRPRRRRRGDVAPRRRHRRDHATFETCRLSCDHKDAAPLPFLATATNPYFSSPFADHSEAEGMGANIHKISACARFASYS